MVIKAENNIKKVKFENIPDDLKQLDYWVLWKLLWDQDERQYKKVPCNVKGTYINATVPNNWLDYETAKNTYLNGGFDGVGIVVDSSNELYVLDVDGTTDDELLDAYSQGTYSEISPSGNGAHIYMFGSKPKKHTNKNEPYELYSHSRFLTVTGDIYGDIDYVAEFDSHLDRLIESKFKLTERKSVAPGGTKYTDDEVINKLMTAKNSDKFKRLYEDADYSLFNGDASSADASLASLIALYTQDVTQIERIMRRSALYRDKWDRRESGTPYLVRTIESSINYTASSNFAYEFGFIVGGAEDLESILIERGIEERKKLEEVNERTGKVKRPRLTPRAVANIIKEVCSVINIDYGDPDSNPFAIYNAETGIYEISPKKHYRLYLCVDDALTENQCKTVTHYLSSGKGIDTKEPTSDSNLQVFKNGIYNKSEQVLMPFSSDYVFTAKIDTNYNPDALEPIYPDWNFTQWITEEVADNDPEKLKMIWQIFANAVDPNTSPKATVFLYSDHSDSSKSTFGNLIWNLVGKSNSASIRIENFDDNQYLWNAYGKAYVYGDENSSKTFLKNADNLKSLSSGDPVTAKLLYHNPISFVATPLVIQSMNNLPNFANFDDGVVNRLRILKFNNRYIGKKKNTKIKAEYIYDKKLHEYILLESLKYESDHIVDSKESQREKDILKEADPMFLFFEQVFSKLQGDKIPVKLLFQVYLQWHFVEMGQEAKLQQNTFTRQSKVFAKQLGYDYDRKNKRVSREEVPDEDMRIYKKWVNRDESYYHSLMDGIKQQSMFYME